MKRLILPFFTTLLFAAILWVAVNLASEVQTTVRIPLEVEFPEGQAAASAVPEVISATLRGPGWQVAQFALLMDPRCSIDLRHAWGLTAPTISHRMMLQGITLPPHLLITELEPDSIAVSMDALRRRTVPVVPALLVECRRGFELAGPLRVEPDSITISGAESVVRTIAAWSTRPMRISNVTSRVTVETPLSDSLGDRIATPHQTVSITADVQQTAERTFTHVPIRVVNLPGGAHVSLQPATATVILRGGVETLAALQPADVYATVDYWSLRDEMPDVAMIDVAAPPHTSVMRQEPRTARWFIRQLQ